MTERGDLWVTSHAVGPVIDEQAYSNLLDEISEGLGAPLDNEVFETEPPAAGMSEIAVVMSFLADSKEVLLPVISWMVGRFGGPAFNTLRDYLDGSRRSRETGRPYVPLCVAFGTNPDNRGSVRFYFHGRPAQKQLERQFEEMYRVIDALPEVALAEMAGPPEYGYFWDEEQSRWRGQLYYSATPDADEVWFPDDLLDRVPGWTAPSDPDETSHS